MKHKAQKQCFNNAAYVQVDENIFIVHCKSSKHTTYIISIIPKQSSEINRDRQTTPYYKWEGVVEADKIQVYLTKRLGLLFNIAKNIKCVQRNKMLNISNLILV